jgi:hypothetical protein
MESSKVKNDLFDLSKAWTNALRRAKKDTISITCPMCADRKALATQDILWYHVLEVHHAEVPSEEDLEEYRKFRENLRTRSFAALKSQLYVNTHLMNSLLLPMDTVMCAKMPSNGL